MVIYSYWYLISPKRKPQRAQKIPRYPSSALLHHLMFSSFKGSFATFHGRVPIVSWFPQSWGYPNSWMFFHGKILLKWRFGGSAHLQKPYIMVKNVGFYGYNLRCHQPNNRGLTWGPQKNVFWYFVVWLTGSFQLWNPQDVWHVSAARACRMVSFCASTQAARSAKETWNR